MGNLYAYHSWDALNYYDKNGYELYMGDQAYWTNSPDTAHRRLGNAYSFKSITTKEVYSRTPSSTLLQYELRLHL